MAIDAQVGAEAPVAAREVAALALTNEATRLFLESDLLAIADRHGSRWRWTVSSTNGTPLDRCGTTPSAQPLTSSGGFIAKSRAQWADDCSLELEAGLVDRTTPALGVQIALG